MGEKRYEIKDHLGNVRAVVSDIKNAENYSLSASSWKFLADVRSMSNYYPYGSLISAGSWSGSSYNYGYNGMLKEAIGDDISHTHFRNLSVGDFVGWWSPDPLEFQFPSYSPYATMGNNPIMFIDPMGDSWLSDAWDAVSDWWSGTEASPLGPATEGVKGSVPIIDLTAPETYVTAFRTNAYDKMLPINFDSELNKVYLVDRFQDKILDGKGYIDYLKQYTITDITKLNFSTKDGFDFTIGPQLGVYIPKIAVDFSFKMLNESQRTGNTISSFEFKVGGVGITKNEIVTPFKEIYRKSLNNISSSGSERFFIKQTGGGLFNAGVTYNEVIQEIHLNKYNFVIRAKYDFNSGNYNIHTTSFIYWGISFETP